MRIVLMKVTIKLCVITCIRRDYLLEIEKYILLGNRSKWTELKPEITLIAQKANLKTK